MPFSWPLVEFILLLIGFSFVGSLIASACFLWLARRFDIVDDPKSNPNRKLQKIPIPLLGGTGFALVATLLMGIIWRANEMSWFNFGAELSKNLEPFNLLWVAIAIVILLIGGFIDDNFRASSPIQLIFINIVVLITVFGGGVTVDSLSYPFNQVLPELPLLPEILAYFWLLFCVGATKFLDGHDGLVSSVGIIALLSIASVAIFSNVDQPMIFIFALIWVAAIAGFLPFNFPNARLYLGEGGSEIIGFIIGVLAILSGAKIATASTVIGWFIIDLFFVWFLRILDRRNPFSSGDRLHWHFRLVDLGLSKLTVLVVTIIILIVTAQSGLLIETEHKPYLLAGQVVFLLAIFSLTEIVRLKKNQKMITKKFQ